MSIVTGPESANGSNNQTQLHDFAVYASHLLARAFSFSYSFVSNATRWSFSPLFLAFPLISYLVAPLLIFATMILKVFFLAPLNMAHHILNSLYPVYAFCGVACITGIVIGMGGRSLSALLTGLFAKTEHGGSASAVRRRSRRRRLRIREEHT